MIDGTQKPIDSSSRARWRLADTPWENDLWQWLCESLDEAGGVASCDRIDLRSGSVIEVIPSAFLTALVWDELLSFSDCERLHAPLRQATSFLLASGCPESGWRFFPDGRGYPPDSDDTAVISEALYRHGLLPNASAVLDLFEHNRTAGGRCYVWLARDGEVRRNHGVDPYVDLNVARCSRLLAGSSVRVSPSMCRALYAFPRSLWSEYYRDPGVKSWLVSRFDRLTYSMQERGREDYERRCRSFQAALPRLHAQSKHPALLASAAATYRQSKSVVDNLLRDMKPAAQIGGILFRHRRIDIGYACLVLELAACCRARALTMNEARRLSVCVGREGSNHFPS